MRRNRTTILLAAAMAIAGTLGAQPYASPNSCPNVNVINGTVTYAYSPSSLQRTVDVEIHAPPTCRPRRPRR